jgi:putative endonuclease
MTDNIVLGQKGESLAQQHLEAQGLTILAQNWRTGHAEVDIIAQEGNIIVFVEVKTRSSDRFGPPEFFITPQKKRMLAGAASVYCEKIEHPGEIRFDVVSIILRDDGKTKLEYLRDAFWPGL